MAFGAGDENVPVEESVNRIQALNNENIILKVYPDGGHGIAEVVAPGFLQIQAEFLRDLVDFIKDKSTGEGS
jgi:dipeptidyl aminopeptidase/acylaminoacyl peptidase